MYSGSLVVECAGNAAFNCCGARCIHGLSSSFPSQKYTDPANMGWSAPRVPLTADELWALKAEFLQKFLQESGTIYAYYFIATTSQLNNFAGENSILSLLCEVGAKEIDARLNQNHGPNKMHMHVWSPLNCKAALSKYVTFGRRYDNEHAFMNNNSADVVIVDRPVPVEPTLVKAKTTEFVPLRDALGRFAAKETKAS
jgi:hypothetical protein